MRPREHRLRQDGRIKVQALSHSSRLVQNMNLVQAVAEAMDEAVDQNTTLCLPRTRAAPSSCAPTTSWRASSATATC